MKIPAYELRTVHGGDPVSFSDFIESEGLKLVVHERSREDWRFTGARYYAEINDCETSERRGLLCAEFGNGNTPAAAIKDFAERIAGKLLVIGAYKDYRREIQCPNEWA